MNGPLLDVCRNALQVGAGVLAQSTCCWRWVCWPPGSCGGAGRGSARLCFK